MALWRVPTGIDAKTRSDFLETVYSWAIEEIEKEELAAIKSVSEPEIVPEKISRFEWTDDDYLGVVKEWLDDVA